MTTPERTLLVMKFVERQGMKWFGHVTRMDPILPTARANNMKMETGTGRGRSMRMWIDEVTGTLWLHNIPAYQATQYVLFLTPIISQGYKSAQRK